MEPKLSGEGGSFRFEVHAKPRAKKSRLGGVRPDGSVEIALAAPPVDGAANEELVRFLAAALGVGKRSVEIVRGGSSQKKLVAVHGLDRATLLEALTSDET
jgi:uncharacterized protein (TIGR00251 family)